MIEDLAAVDAEPKIVMVEATYFMAHCTPPDRANQERMSTKLDTVRDANDKQLRSRSNVPRAT